MILSVINKNKIKTYDLPTKVDGSYLINDEKNDKLSLNIESLNGRWVLKKNGIDLINGQKPIEDIVLTLYQFYILQTNQIKNPLILYCTPQFDPTFVAFDVKPNTELLIGNNNNNHLIYKNNLVSPHHAKLIYNNGHWHIQDLNSNYLTYVNNEAAFKRNLIAGDIIFIMGLKIIIVGNFILINNPLKKVFINQHFLTLKKQKPFTFTEEDLLLEETEIKLYQEDDYFLRSPRLRTGIEKVTITIDPPPLKQEQEEVPLIFTIGPMITMGMTSMVMGGVALNNVMNNNQELSSALPTLIISGAMLASMILWPLLSKKHQKKQEKLKERKRQTKYNEYIDQKRKEIQNAINLQKNILTNNYVSLNECKEIIISKKEDLWGRKIEDSDFLNLRIGIGVIKPELDINYPEKHFSLEEDNLRANLDLLIYESKDIKDVPICLSLTEKYTTAIVGDDLLTKRFIEGLILQLITFHSYEDVKIILFTSEQKLSEWKYLKVLPHLFTDDKEMRFLGANANEMGQISHYLEEVFNQRKYKTTATSLEENNQDYLNYSPYYIIITDNLKVARHIKIVKDTLSQKTNYGFSILIQHDKFSDLPNECSTFINIAENQSGVFEKQVTASNLKGFQADFNTAINMRECTISLANIPISLSINKVNLPNAVTFLEMYEIGKVEQLNLLEKWKTNNPVISLSAPIGIGETGEPFFLDLHEKFHGPHGLIAGMTGSGKSEFIISYILSLAVNFHPHELSIILIDYKGGGIAGAFENNETGVKLPHLAGTITNLDTVELKRSLMSIESELKRRQRIFYKARELLNESTIDIYKYQRLYREGLVDTPVSHLFIISDEFAELKVQQPEFMEQLISTARIGRSLGVHLILATQKPSGVVDDQIWSNSKFRICFKVQEKADSMDMIKSPEAATLKHVGRFYLQVGYNEFFALAQAAWCGAKYIPMNKFKKKIDTTINFIDNTGYVLKHADHRRSYEAITGHGEELTNIVKYLSEIAKKEKIIIPQLWLNRIPDFIYVDDLKKKYDYQIQPYFINPIMGEYDDPANQRQDLLTLNLTNEGNAVVFGATGSGKEILLNTIIYSTIINHSVDEVNFYLLDFGAETLINFRKAPQIGDILLINDNEKITNLFKMLKEIIEERKKLFIDYNGDYRFFIQNSDSKLPLIIVIINYYEGFSETYDHYEDILLQLTREGFKYGITFILTANGINMIRYRLLQNFKQLLTLQLNDETDYSSILGKIEGVYPSKIKGRGLVKMENIYEFQTAYPYHKDDLPNFIKRVSLILNEKAGKRAKAVPILPEDVNLEFINPYINKLTHTPIGVVKNTLEIADYDFKNRFGTLISALELETINQFIISLIKVISLINNNNLIIIDAEEIINLKEKPNITYYKNNFNQIFSSLDQKIDEQYQLYVNNHYQSNILKTYNHTLCFIIGIDKLLKKTDKETIANFETLFKKGKDLTTFSFVLVDAVDKIKLIEYEPWYKALINNNNGLWGGDGITDQFALKISKTNRELYEENEPGFGYQIKNGIPLLIKLLNFEEELISSNNEEAVDILEL